MGRHEPAAAGSAVVMAADVVAGHVRLDISLPGPGVSQRLFRQAAGPGLARGSAVIAAIAKPTFGRYIILDSLVADQLQGWISHQGGEDQYAILTALEV